MAGRSIPRENRTTFEKRYFTALRAHVRADAEPRSGPAWRLGLRACELGIETLALARIHDRSFCALDPPRGKGSLPRPGRAVRAVSFFAEAMGPIEATHRPALEALAARGRLGRSVDRGIFNLASAKGRLTQETGRRRVAQEALATNRSEHRVRLQRGAVELASAQGRLSQETGRRRVAQEALATSESGRRVLVKRSTAMEEELRQLSRSLLTSHEEERKRISRELHDALGQTLSAVNIGLASLKTVAVADPRVFRVTVLRTQRLVQKSMRTVHLFARHLRPALLDDLGLVPALLAFTKEFGRRNGLRVRVSAPEESWQLDGDRRTALFRVAQEALINVGRHAQARNVSVTLRGTADGVRLEVWNDGKPFDVTRIQRSGTHRHLGLLCMRERMDMVGGTFSVQSTQENGTTVRADVPLREHACA